MGDDGDDFVQDLTKICTKDTTDLSIYSILLNGDMQCIIYREYLQTKSYLKNMVYHNDSSRGFKVRFHTQKQVLIHVVIVNKYHPTSLSPVSNKNSR